jgi:hypothetical protein
MPLPTLVLKERFAKRLPVAVGRKATLTWQEPFGPSVPPEQVSPAMTKSLTSPPVRLTEVIDSVPVPPLVRRTVWKLLMVVSGCVPKLSAPGSNATWAVTPRPFRPIVSGIPLVIITVRPPLRVPPACGEKRTVMLQDAPGASVVVTQVSRVLVKSPECRPFSVTLETATGPLELLVSVTVCGALFAPTWMAPNSRLGALTVRVGAVPMPSSATERGLPAAVSSMRSVALRLPVAVGLKATPIWQVPPAAIVAPTQLLP